MNKITKLTDAELSSKVDEAVRRRNNAPTNSAEQAAREDVDALRDEMARRLAKKMGL